ncbi:MAG: damage-inducible protein DinB [Bacillales bacterium]|nr:damage-inducible protein DinB [Bacillales bacterium]
MLAVPNEKEYPPFYKGYISKIDTDDIIKVLQQQLSEILEIFNNISEEQSLHRYAEGKWSIKELVGHMCDTERIMTFRILHVARGDKNELPGFDEDTYVQNANFDNIPFLSLVKYYQSTREASISLIENLTKTTSTEAWENTCVVNGNSISARAIAYIIAGHELHHRSILEERYLEL